MKFLANLVTRHYKVTLGVWIILFVALAFFALRLPSLLEGDGFKMDGEHQQVMDELTETFDLPAETLFIVFDQTSDQTIQDTLDDIENLKIVKDIQSPLEDSTLYKENVSYAMLHFNTDPDNMSEVVGDIRRSI